MKKAKARFPESYGSVSRILPKSSRGSQIASENRAWDEEATRIPKNDTMPKVAGLCCVYIINVDFRNYSREKLNPYMAMICGHTAWLGFVAKRLKSLALHIYQTVISLREVPGLGSVRTRVAKLAIADITPITILQTSDLG